MTSEEFKNKRLELGFIFQKDLGSRLGMHGNHISRIEGGQRKPSKQLIKMLDLLEEINNLKKELDKPTTGR